MQQSGKNLILTLVFLIHSIEIYCDDISINGANQQRGLDFTIQICTSRGNCQPENVGLVMDYSYFCADPTACYVVNQINKKCKQFFLSYFNQISDANKR